MKIFVGGTWHKETAEKFAEIADKVGKAIANRGHILVTGGGTGMSKLVVEGYRSVNGKKYQADRVQFRFTGNMIFFSGGNHLDSEKADIELRTYKQGDNIEIHYNADDPNQAVIKTEVPEGVSSSFWAFMIGFLVTFPLTTIIMFLGWKKPDVLFNLFNKMNKFGKK